MASLVHVTEWEKASVWRRILCAFSRVGILVALLIVLFELLGPPLGFLITSRWEATKAPWLKVTPTPLVNYSTSDAAGTELSYFGYEFEVPWNAPYKTKAIGKGGLVELQFESGQNVTFIVPANQNGLFTEIAQDKSLHMENLQVILGDLVNRPAYDQYETLLSTTPSSIRAFGPRTEAVRGMTLLTIKAIAVAPGLETGVFSFELPEKRGFQVGDPQKSKRVDLEVFGMGGHHVEIICATTKDTVRLTQPGLNRILKTLHPLSEGTSAEPQLKSTSRRSSVGIQLNPKHQANDPDYYGILLHSQSLADQRQALEQILDNPETYVASIQRSLREYPRLLRTDPTAAERGVYLAALIRDPSFPPILVQSLGVPDVLDDCEYACPIVFALTISARFGASKVPAGLDSKLTTVEDLKEGIASISHLNLKVGSLEDVVQGPEVAKYQQEFQGKTEAQLIQLAGPATSSQETRTFAAYRLETLVSSSKNRIDLYLLALNDFEDASGEYRDAVYQSIYRAELAKAEGK
jgi:hypothetical protein